ncbi:MAG: hypothetical protein SH817_08460 [Leptospira sp.]|nr:hypothetical protein [Leptospira sp.]
MNENQIIFKTRWKDHESFFGNPVIEYVGNKKSGKWMLTLQCLSPKIRIGQCDLCRVIDGTDLFEDDWIRDIRTGVEFQIIFNEEFLGWWCVSKDKTIECPLNSIIKFHEKIIQKEEKDDTRIQVTIQT